MSSLSRSIVLDKKRDKTMNQEEFMILLKKHIDNNCSIEEKDILKKLFSEKKTLKKLLLEDLNNFQLPGTGEEVDFDRIFTNLKNKIKEDADKKSISDKSRKYKIITRYLQVAAIWLLIFVSGGIVSRLFLNWPSKNKISYCEVIAPLGASSKVILPDKSIIWLNAGSNIKYSTNFNQKNRDVNLEGEAYFKVAKNKKLPFIVHAAGIQVKAVGTEFNVKAYKNEGTIETTLIEGIVTLKGSDDKKSQSNEITLKPNQKAIFINSKNQLTINSNKSIVSKNSSKIENKKIYILNNINTLPQIAWKENRLIIDGERLSDLSVKLQRKYNVKINFNSDFVKQFRFSGTLEDETLQQVLDVIKLSSPIGYKIEGKTVTIYEDKKAQEEFNEHLK